MGKLRAGIVGLEHWYAGLGAMQVLSADDRVELVVVAHSRLDLAGDAIAQAGAEATDDYASVAARDDLDLIVTACPTVRNAALCTTAARSGKHILSVKPYAMNLAEAAALRDVVHESGVQFMTFDALYRLDPATISYREWVTSGRLGQPISAFCMLRSALPTQLWPGVHGETWWLDDTQVWGGGWADHAIYLIDRLRFVMDSEPIRVSGEISKLKHPDQPFEDFGVANVVFDNGCVATIEVTWTVDAHGGVRAFHLVGAKGQIINEPSVAPGKLFTSDEQSNGLVGHDLAEQSTSDTILTRAVDCILGEAEPVATIDDSYANLRACLAFYEAAANHTVVAI